MLNLNHVHPVLSCFILSKIIRQDKIRIKQDINLKVASVIWPDMQGTGHAAYVTYCKCPVTQHIQPKGAPAGFACFEFFLTHLFDETADNEY